MYPQSYAQEETDLERANLYVAAQASVYDQYYNISSTLDGQIKMFRKNFLTRIKTLSDDELQILSEDHLQVPKEMWKMCIIIQHKKIINHFKPTTEGEE